MTHAHISEKSGSSPPRTPMATTEQTEFRSDYQPEPIQVPARPAPAPFRQSLYRDCTGEFFGTFILVLVGDAALAQFKLSRGEASDWASVSGAWGAALALGVIVAGQSGGHLNPAVTLAMALFRRFPIRKVPFYVLSQFLGALVAAAMIWGVFRDSIYAFEGSRTLTVPPADNATAGIFATYPAAGIGSGTMVLTEILATGLLVFFIFAITDQHSPLAMGRLVPVGLFFIFWVITSSFGFQTGFAVNPARDFGPRLMTSMVGYGRQVWTARNHYFVIPLFAPFIGAAFGGAIYDLFLYRGRDSWLARLTQKVLRERTDPSMV